MMAEETLVCAADPEGDEIGVAVITGGQRDSETVKLLEERSKLQLLSSLRWRRGQGRGVTFGSKQARSSTKLDHPAPEPVFGDGKDAFHRVPDFARNERDAMERVLTKY